MEVEKLQEALRQSQESNRRLSEQLVNSVDRFTELSSQLSLARKRIEELTAELAAKKGGPPNSGSPTEKIDQPFSLTAEERRRRKRNLDKAKKKPLRRGRVTTADKLKLATRTEQVFPEGFTQQECVLSHTRPVWRLENGVAAIVAYEVWRHNKSYGRIPDVIGRSEYGLEFLLAIAYQVYVIGLSLDKVVLLTHFFQRLKLRKSQIDAMLNQLARHWEGQFETLCGLMANSMIVHADETSWSINSVWTFLSEKARLFLFGVHKDAQTLKQILDPETFKGLVVSDDAAVYGKFTHSQKCWAHLLRKAIRITLLEPEDDEFRKFCDELLDIYRSAVRVRNDGRLGPAGLERKVDELDDRILDLCLADWVAELPKQEGALEEYRLLVKELMKLMLAQELFCFVTASDAPRPNGQVLEASGTNNEAERSLRGAATARVTGRTNKTSKGARRQSIIHSVLESLRCFVIDFRLDTIIDEIHSWSKQGVSCFERVFNELSESKQPKPPRSVLDHLFPSEPLAPETG